MMLPTKPHPVSETFTYGPTSATAPIADHDHTTPSDHQHGNDRSHRNDQSHRNNQTHLTKGEPR